MSYRNIRNSTLSYRVLQGGKESVRSGTELYIMVRSRTEIYGIVNYRRELYGVVQSRTELY